MKKLRVEEVIVVEGKYDAVKLADLVPWDEAEEVYARQFVNNGHPAHPARIALGALIRSKRMSRCFFICPFLRPCCSPSPG